MISQILFVGGTSLCVYCCLIIALPAAAASDKSGPGRHQLLQHTSRHVEQSGGVECGQVSCDRTIGVGCCIATLQTKLDFLAKFSQLIYLWLNLLTEHLMYRID